MNTFQSNACPDAETLAAWSDQGLPAAELRAVEAHVAGCARCLAHAAALARSAPIAGRAPSRAPLWVAWRWMVPAAVGVAALGLWLAVPAPQTSMMPSPSQPPASVPAPPPSVEARSEPSATASRPAASPQPAERRDAAPLVPRRAQAESTDASASLQKAAPPAQAPPAANGNAAEALTVAPAATPPPAAPAAAPPAQPALNAAARTMARMDAVAPAVEIISTDRSIRWRIQGVTVERTTDGGATWTRQTSATAPLTAGAAPSADICWIVGRSGIVLRTIDGGASWQAIAGPDRADLTQVAATGPSTATVTTSDARRFTTDNAGASWRPGGLQDF